MKPKPAKPVAPETPQPAQGEQQPRGDVNTDANATADTDAGTGDVPPPSGEPMETDKSEAPPSAS